MRSSFLAFAARSGDVQEIAALIELGYDVHVVDVYGNTPLHWACHAGSKEAVKILLRAGANPNAVNRRGWTPVHFAARGGVPAVVRALLSSDTLDGVDVAIPNDDGLAPIHLMANDDVAAQFLSRAKDRALVPCRELLAREEEMVNMRDRTGRTPLHWAAARGDLKAAEAMLQEGADWTTIDDDKYSARDLALAGNHHRIALLIDSYAAGSIQECLRCGLFVLDSRLNEHDQSDECRAYGFTFKGSNWSMFPRAFHDAYRAILGGLYDMCTGSSPEKTLGITHDLSIPTSLLSSAAKEYYTTLLRHHIEQSRGMSRHRRGQGTGTSSFGSNALRRFSRFTGSIGSRSASRGGSRSGGVGAPHSDDDSESGDSSGGRGHRRDNSARSDTSLGTISEAGSDAGSETGEGRSRSRGGRRYKETRKMWGVEFKTLFRELAAGDARYRVIVNGKAAGDIADSNWQVQEPAEEMAVANAVGEHRSALYVTEGAEMLDTLHSIVSRVFAFM